MLWGGGGGAVEGDFKGEGGSNVDPQSKEGGGGGAVEWVTACFPLICCPWQPHSLFLSFSFPFFPPIFSFSHCTSNYICLMHILTAFFSSLLASTVSPSLSSKPELCFFSLFLSSASSLMTFFSPNDHFFSSSPTPFRIPSLSLSRSFWLSSRCTLVPSNLLLSLSEWVCGWHSDDRHTARTHCYCHYPQCTTLTRMLKFLQPDSSMLVDWFVSGDKVTTARCLTGAHTDATLSSSLSPGSMTSLSVHANKQAHLSFKQKHDVENQLGKKLLKISSERHLIQPIALVEMFAHHLQISKHA